jgi:phosphoserine phosphatase
MLYFRKGTIINKNSVTLDMGDSDLIPIHISPVGTHNLSYAVFFDLEGTLNTPATGNQYPSLWPVIAEVLGPQCKLEEDRLTAIWTKQHQQVDGPKQFTSYKHFVDESVKLHQDYGLTQSVFEDILERVPWINGIEQTFARIKASRGLIGIVTGGFVNQATKVPGSHYVDHFKAACEYFFDASGKIHHWESADYDWHGKVTAIREIVKSYGMSMADVHFVGDGKNDIHIMQEVGHPIAFNAHSDLRVAVRQITTGRVVEGEDLRTILTHLLIP